MENKDMKILTNTELEETVGGYYYENEADAQRLAQEYPVGTRVALGVTDFSGKEMTGVIIESEVIPSPGYLGFNMLYRFEYLIVLIDEDCRLMPELAEYRVSYRDVRKIA